MTKNTDTREIALDILIEILEHDGYSHIVIRQALEKYQYLEKQDRAFISRLTEGTLEYLIQIDAVINQFSKIKVRKMKPLIRTLLRMSVYQLMYMDRIPDSAVCNEAVKLAVKRKFQGLKGFVNGVLRSIARNKETLSFDTDSLKYSVPQWMIDLWEQSYPKETVQTILSSFLGESPLFVRCNLAITDKDTIIRSLQSQEVTVFESPYSDAMLMIKNIDYLDHLEAFQKGYIQVQDLSSSFVGDAADPRPGDYVIDVCGAPGGKSLHIADKLHSTGMVEVRDLTEYKVNMIQDNISRCNFTNIRARVWDALELDLESVEKADIVIADLPCSGLGIIGKKPDIKYNMTPDKIASLVELQRNILSVVYQYVKPGGILVYSTCTIDQQENQDNVDWFLSQYPFQRVDISGRLKGITEASVKSGWMQFLPGIHPCDGFFLSVLKRV